jgi:Holliday junction resolvase RusA-like endonuclease
MIVSFVISGVPIAKGRPRLTTRNGFARAYTPEKTRRFETVVAEQARAALGPMDAFTGPVELEAHFSLPIPKSWSKRDKAAALAGSILPQSKPDLDNYLKAIADGMNEVVYKDDCQIVSCRLTKRYGEEPGVAVTVRPA